MDSASAVQPATSWRSGAREMIWATRSRLLSVTMMHMAIPSAKVLSSGMHFHDQLIVQAVR